MTVSPDVHVPTDTVVVTLSDDDLRWRLGTLLEPGPSTLVLDLSRLQRLSATTIAVLLWVRRRCRARGVRVVLRRPSRGSIDVLRRAGLQSALEIEPRKDGSTGAPA